MTGRHDACRVHPYNLRERTRNRVAYTDCRRVWPVARIFPEVKETTGVPPYKWLSACRKVIELLTETRERLNVISAQCGYVDQSHMGRVFLRQTGITPAEWRRRFGKSSGGHYVR
ncbi:helix-turn-helix domain-containing protein [Rhizobium sullae]|uniref:helix-turn-helix domain-containing protein n=1 Tax=Rhizobium sullae TaxID=50338 RepID=UPI00104C0F1F